VVFGGEEKTVCLCFHTDNRRQIEHEWNRKDVDTAIRKNSMYLGECAFMILHVLKHIFRNHYIKRLVREGEPLKVLAKNSLFNLCSGSDFRQKVGAEKMFVVVKHALERIIDGSAEDSRSRADSRNHRYVRNLGSELALKRLSDMPLAGRAAAKKAVHVIPGRDVIGAYEQRRFPAYVAAARPVMSEISGGSANGSSH